MNSHLKLKLVFVGGLLLQLAIGICVVPFGMLVFLSSQDGFTLGPGSNDWTATEPRGQFLLRQFIGDTFSERSIYLHLDDPRVDDEWIKQLGPMEHIEVLSIRSPNLTDVGLKELVNWPKLQSLNLVDTQVSDAAIEWLRKIHPSLRFAESRQTVP